ncbi:branched-chain amino acid ABC transporter permease [Herbaspirillum chlorophenolicum]|uniref:branched-chain amino acid ABC transporter permease n=1 Tax=Herbaspirillum chlorophenolicum TaxID=211589 RepID=UPI0009E1E8DB|nr:branched-chain amino acid ABC transporter permease [Herbaspirillum chlorophenolicum]
MNNRIPIIACLLLGVAAIAALPLLLETFTLMELSVYVIMSILALSLGFVWGYGGILCFGQAAFFGLGAYAYAIAAINFGESTGAFLVAIAVPTLFALALGYFIFFGRISDVYLGVITLTATLILFNLVNSTSGEQYKIGQAAIGGFNGIPSIPTLNIPFQPDQVLSPEVFFMVCVAFLMASYIGLRLLLASHFGRVVVALRENELRVDLLGYDSRKYKLAAFAISGALAGVAGCLFANWGAFTSPTVFSLTQSALVIIWVLVGGVGTLLGPIIGCFFVQWLTSYIGGLGFINPNLMLGAVLIGFVLLLPKGIVSLFGDLGKLFNGGRRAAPAEVRPLSQGGKP